ncbi:transcriptional regulator [Propioniciclava sp. MC1595]|nr:transcriptional regulator [Propioniciclava sp. MC1595]
MGDLLRTLHQGPGRSLAQDHAGRVAVTLGSGWVAGFGVSRQSVNAIGTGKFDPSLPVAFRLALLFELPIEDIFSFEPTP